MCCSCFPQRSNASFHFFFFFNLLVFSFYTFYILTYTSCFSVQQHSEWRAKDRYHCTGKLVFNFAYDNKRFDLTWGGLEPSLATHRTTARYSFCVYFVFPPCKWAWDCNLCSLNPLQGLQQVGARGKERRRWIDLFKDASLRRSVRFLSLFLSNCFGVGIKPVS